MTPLVYAFLAVVLVTAACLAVIGGTWYRRFRGQRLVTCPQNHLPAAVKVDAMVAGISAAMGEPTLRLHQCSRWPERAGCGQECLRQIEHAPAECLVRNIVTQWYADKTCVYCKHGFGEIHWHDHKPALADPELGTMQWSQVPVEKLPEFFARCQPVCWNCHIAQAFQREHPDLVTYRRPSA